MIRAEILIQELAWEDALADADALVRQAAEATPGEGEATILLTNMKQVRDLNARFRDRHAATNVLAFPAADTYRPYLGDVALAFEVCRLEADEQCKTLADHLRHLVVHALLHLLGYDHVDSADAERMEALERQILQRLNVPDPYGEPG